VLISPQGEGRRQKDDSKTSKTSKPEKPKTETEDAKHSTKRCTDVSADVAKRRTNDGCKKPSADDGKKGKQSMIQFHYKSLILKSHKWKKPAFKFLFETF
jgi:hypothetical protein